MENDGQTLHLQAVPILGNVSPQKQRKIRIELQGRGRQDGATVGQEDGPRRVRPGLQDVPRGGGGEPRPDRSARPLELPRARSGRGAASASLCTAAEPSNREQSGEILIQRVVREALVDADDLKRIVQAPASAAPMAVAAVEGREIAQPDARWRSALAPPPRVCGEVYLTLPYCLRREMRL